MNIIYVQNSPVLLISYHKKNIIKQTTDKSILTSRITCNKSITLENGS